MEQERRNPRHPAVRCLEPVPPRGGTDRAGRACRRDGRPGRRGRLKKKVLRRSPGSLLQLPLRLRPDFQGLRGMPMFDRKTIEKLGGWEGYRVERIEWPQGESRTVTIHLTPSSRAMSCAHCGSRCRQVHETTVRRGRDLPLRAVRVALAVPRRRVWCVQCGGPRLEKLSWLGRYQRVTDRLAEAVSQLLASSNIVAVARFFQLGWHTVKALDKAQLRQAVRAPDWTRIHYLAMDEFALHKGHRYATVVVDPVRGQVLWVGNGRSRETARAFFEQLPAGVAAQIRAVAIDMTTAYELEIKANCPNAEIVYDLFHVVAK